MLNDDLNGIRVISQNVNSLNLSTRLQLNNNLNRFDQKIESILSKNADIILLQDVRLGPLGHDILKKRLKFSKYGSFALFSNSTKSCRGVAVIIKETLPYKIVHSVSCPLENYLLLKISLWDSAVFIIGSVYGPTLSQDPLFMTNLEHDILSFESDKFLIGGDLNMVSDPRKISNVNNFNLDIKNMAQIPNVINSLTLASWCDTGFVTDIFRHFYQDRRIFSHVPFNKNDHSRSRIDHFLCSNEFINSFSNLTYLAIDSKLFDHKCVLLETTKKSNKNLSFIDPSCLDVPGLKQVAALETLGTFIDYLDPEENREFLVNINLELVAARTILAEIISIRNSICNHPYDLLIPIFIETKCNEIDVLISPFLNISNIIQTRPITIEYDKFLETLLNNLHNAIITHQRAHKRIVNNTLKDFREKLVKLQKRDLNIESNDYKEQLKLEKLLLDFDDDLTLRKCARTKLWHTMNFEKPTKAFCALSKASKGNDSLNQLKKIDAQGNLIDYESENERNFDLNKYFKNVYSKIPDKTLTLDQFLSPEILNSDYVQSKKLSDIQSNADNVPISHRELSKALDETKIGSSPGLDGFTYSVIKFLWSLIGHPITKGFEIMIEKGELYSNLRTASIKLIPKKGDCEQIKNWRPISLLSNIYKVYSKAFANRLKLNIDKNTSKTQKAYSTNKSIHEALINILQCIKKGKNENKKIALLAIDFKKAFDSVSHDYIIEILKFLNYSDYMIKIVKTMMKGKRAGILTDTGIADFFEILCGVAQGDAPSGLLFIIALEPLLWKLLMDPGIIHPVFDNGESLSDSSFADDVSIFVEGDSENIINCKSTLDDFSKLSGLTINVEKTNVLPINVSPEFENEIRVTGFTIVKKITILGLEISETFEQDQVNFKKLLSKIRGMSIFWAKFKLSTVGRINLAKTYLLSQISYFAPVISFSTEQILTLTNEIGFFIKGNLKISISKVYEQVKFGGLGMISIDFFINAMKISFFRKSIDNTDFWANELKLFRVTDSFPFHLKSRIALDTPCGELANVMRNYCNIFWATDSNIIDAKIFDNELTCLENGEKLGLAHFRRNRTEMEIQTIKKIRVLNFLDVQDNYKFSLRTLRAYLGVGFILTELEIFNLRSIFHKIARTHNLNEVCTPIASFFGKIKRGSKKIRSFYVTSDKEIKNNRGLIKRGILADSMRTDKVRDCNFNLTFCSPKLSHNLRSFIFSFTAHILYNNSMISHFVRDFDPTCKRCEYAGLRPAPKESLLHIFWECPGIQIILNDVNIIISNDPLTDINLREILFLGSVMNLKYDIKKTNLICVTTLFFIFSTRNKKSTYSLNNLLNFFKAHTNQLLSFLY